MLKWASEVSVLYLELVALMCVTIYFCYCTFFFASALQPIEGQSLPNRSRFTCSQTEEKDHLVSFVGFTDRDYRYKSVATQIPHDTNFTYHQ